MRAALQKLRTFLEKNTSGFPFVLWAVFAVSITLFIVVFRQAPNINFEKLKYVLLLGAGWFVGSDMVKARKMLNGNLHFILDSFFYIIFFNLLVFFTGGVGGGLMVVLIAAMISTPFFSGNLGSAVFFFFLSVSVVIVHLVSRQHIDPYETGLLFVDLVSFFVIIAMIRYFIERQKSIESKKAGFSREALFKTQELQRTLEELNRNRAALKDKIERLEQFQKLVVGRELKMIELKKRIRDLEEQLDKETES